MLYAFIVIGLVLAWWFAAKWFAGADSRLRARGAAGFAFVFLCAVVIALLLTGKFTAMLPFAAGALIALQKLRTGYSLSLFIGQVLRRLGVMDAKPIGDDSERGGPPRAKPDEMSADEALDILGLTQAASAQDIKHAHRRLMKQMHPDRGGSEFLAQQINRAKEVLLKDID